MTGRRVSSASLLAQHPHAYVLEPVCERSGWRRVEPERARRVARRRAARACACELHQARVMTCVKSTLVMTCVECLRATLLTSRSAYVPTCVHVCQVLTCHASPYVPRFSRSSSRNRQNFGMLEGQITMMKQNKVPAMVDVQARFAGQAPLAPTTSSSCSHHLCIGGGAHSSQEQGRASPTQRDEERAKSPADETQRVQESEWYQTQRVRVRVLSARRAPGGHSVRRCAAAPSRAAACRRRFDVGVCAYLHALTLVPARAQARTAL
jgi:hypothetical protein